MTGGPRTDGAPSLPRLELTQVVKQFGGALALRDAGLSIAAGEVHGLLGENGSGKSTLIKILAGYHTPDAGTLLVDGAPESMPLTAERLAELGIAFVHQDLGLIDSLSVTENLFMRELAVRRGGFIRWRTQHDRTRTTLAQYGMHVRGAEPVSALSPFHRAMLAVIRALEAMRHGAPGGRGLLVLDEAMAFMADDERRHLSQTIRQLTATGVSVLLVTHDLDDALAFCDRITVLRNGAVSGVVDSQSTKPDALAELILGRAARSVPARSRSRSERVPLMVATGRAPGVPPFRIEVRSGEIVGITGLAGDTFTDIPYLLFGAVKGAEGTLHLGDRTYSLGGLTPEISLRRGIALVPGDRQRQGAIGSLTVQENMLIPQISRFPRRPIARRASMAGTAIEMVDRYDVRPPRPQATMSTLSGGNQQKAIVAKWLDLDPRLLLLDEPTVGVDIGSREEIFRYVKDLAARGTGVLCASVDYAQLAALCDRVLIYSRGTQIHEIADDAITKDEILMWCLLQDQASS